MKIGLIDCDYTGKFPNIPLMKLSAWHKQHGDSVQWYDPFSGVFDRVYISKVFSFSADFGYYVNAKEIIKGGTGYAITTENEREHYDKTKDNDLPYEIEHIYPDYDLYNIKDTAYGFLSRGCPRGCAFCHVAAKEGKCSVKAADLNEFWNGQQNIVLSDPNILACRESIELLTQLAKTNAIVDFNQGLDARLLTDEKINLLSKIKLKEVRFAWDNYNDKDIIIPKLRLFAKSNNLNRRERIVYCLVNFDTTFEQDLERVYTLRELDFNPYIMIYNKKHCAKIYNHLQRWVNNRFIFETCKKFEDYNP
jgi:hypothetical protein